MRGWLDGNQVENHATLWSNLQNCRVESVAKESKTSRYILGFLVVLVFSIKVKDQQILVTGVVRMVVDSNVIVSSIAEAE